METRRQHELELLKGYIASLQSKTDVKLEWDTVWWQYRRQTMTPVWVAVIAGMLCVVSSPSPKRMMDANNSLVSPESPAANSSGR